MSAAGPPQGAHSAPSGGSAAAKPQAWGDHIGTLRLALRLVARDFRAGELRVLLVAIVLAVASVGTVAIFADRVKQGLVLQSNKLLGADLMVSGDRPLPAAYAEEAKRLGLATSPAIRFNSMVALAHAPD